MLFHCLGTYENILCNSNAKFMKNHNISTSSFGSHDIMVVQKIFIAAFLKLLCLKNKLRIFTNFALGDDMFTKIVLRHPKMCVAVLNRFYDFLAFCT